MKFKSPGTVAVAALSVFLITSPSSVAQGSELVEEYSVNEESQGYQTTLTIQFAKPTPRQSAKSQVEDLAGDVEESSPNIIESPQLDTQGNKLFKLKCSTPFDVHDANGHIAIQHKCGSSKSPWGFWINKNIQNRITGKVKERGMDSTIAGARKGRQAAHKVDKNYNFHGTFSAKDNQTIQYSDKFTFPVGLNFGTIKISGKVKFTR